MVTLLHDLESNENALGAACGAPPTRGGAYHRRRTRTLGAGGSAAFTAVLAYSAYAPGAGAAAGGAQCGLSAAQVDMVQSVLQGRNVSCSYNISLDEILGM